MGTDGADRANSPAAAELDGGSPAERAAAAAAALGG